MESTARAAAQGNCAPVKAGWDAGMSAIDLPKTEQKTDLLTGVIARLSVCEGRKRRVARDGTARRLDAGDWIYLYMYHHSQ